MFPKGIRSRTNCFSNCVVFASRACVLLLLPNNGASWVEDFIVTDNSMVQCEVSHGGIRGRCGDRSVRWLHTWQTHTQETERGDCWGSACLLSFMQCKIPAHKMEPLTFRVAPPTSVKTI